MRLLTAIVHTSEPQINGKQFLKYRNISDTETARRKFIKFAAGFPGAQYVNWYDRFTKQYLGRDYINS